MGQWRQGECLPPCIKTLHSLVNRIVIWLVFCSVLFVGLAVVVVRGSWQCWVKHWLTIFGLVRWCLWNNTQLPTLLVEKGLHQEGHPAVKFRFKPEGFNVMSNIVVRNNRTGTLSEGVVNGRVGVNVSPIRSISGKILQKDLNYELHP